MPGPSNSNSRKKLKNGTGKKRARPRLSLESTASDATASSASSADIRTPPLSLSPGARSPKLADDADEALFADAARYECHGAADAGAFPKPFMHDPGNGTRVRDMRAFLTSPFNFAQPPAYEDPLCAEFAREEVLQMLCTVLPEETALILWYNKSRATSRICPACQRLYRLGDVLLDHVDVDEDDEHAPRADQRPPPQLEREQEISGLCSPVCFILASYNHPAAITSAWGHTADEMDDAAWALLNRNSAGTHTVAVSAAGLGMLVRMTRLHDLGLAQLCLPDVDWEDADATAILA
ncbi:hypothetical protein FB451DRAFT_1136821 [Mycena latifolia]|nr:hypothetical protein FB451DRAFT_1136821 [Mycena latifolia]